MPSQLTEEEKRELDRRLPELLERLKGTCLSDVLRSWNSYVAMPKTNIVTIKGGIWRLAIAPGLLKGIIATFLGYPRTADDPKHPLEVKYYLETLPPLRG